MLPEKLNRIKEIMYRLLSNTTSDDSDLSAVMMDQKLDITQYSGSKNVILQIQNANIKFINNNVVEVFKLLDDIEKEEVIDVRQVRSDYDNLLLDLVKVAYDRGMNLESLLDDIKIGMLDMAINQLPTNNAAARRLGLDPTTVGKWIKRYEL